MRYRKRPSEVEARCVGMEPWKGLAVWCGGDIIKNGHRYEAIIVRTIEQWAYAGYFIILDGNGQFSVHEPSVFEALYELDERGATEPGSEG